MSKNQCATQNTGKGFSGPILAYLGPILQLLGPILSLSLIGLSINLTEYSCIGSWISMYVQKSVRYTEYRVGFFGANFTLLGPYFAASRAYS